VIENNPKNGDPLKLPTTLNTDDLRARAEKPPKYLVGRKNKSLGYIRYRKRYGRITYEWVRTDYRAGLPPLQVIVKYIGRVLPPGVRLGKVDEKTAKKLSEVGKDRTH